MDSFSDAQDLLENLQPSDHDDGISLNHEQTTTNNTDLLTNVNNNNSLFAHHHHQQQQEQSYRSANNHNNNGHNCGDEKPSNSDNENDHRMLTIVMSNEHPEQRQSSPVATAIPATQLANVDKSQILTMIHLLKKYNFNATEKILLKETANFINDDDIKNLANVDPLKETNFSSLVYQTEENPNIYEDNYKQLQRFVDSSLDSYRHELSKLLYPVFVHMYLELVCSGHEEQAISFMRLFGKQQEFCYTDDINRLSLITKRDHLSMYNEVLESFRNSQQLYTIRLSRDSYNYLKRFLQDKSQTSSGKATILVNIIQEHLFIDVYEGLTRSKMNVEALSGAMFGEASRDINKKRVYYGLFKEPDLKIDMFDLDIDLDCSSQHNVNSNDVSMNDATGGSSTTTTGHASFSMKKKKMKKDSSHSKKARNDPNAPPLTRIPIPELRDTEQLEKRRAKKEATKALKLENDLLPSICLYTLLNAQQTTNETSAICAEISDDSTLLAVGFSDSFIRIWPLTPGKLRGLKPANELEHLDKESDDVILRIMMDMGGDLKILFGHSGPVYGLSFSPCRDMLLSCSEDTTIRLWSLLTWTNVVVFKGHCFPVWNVKFSPHGYYFASCSHDRTARLWATDNHNPLRYFTGHFADVDCVQFHPNSNYVATSSSDRSIRLWDCLNGQCVRLMTGHKDNVHVLAFENSGRFLASAGADKRILIWDLASGHLVADFSGIHTNSIYTLAFNRGPESIILASGGLDNRVILWNMKALVDDLDFQELTPTSMPTIKSKSETYLLAKYPTKSTYILLNHFTRLNSKNPVDIGKVTTNATNLW
ncbi:transcription initiation factor tfiid subunit 5-like protein [Dermatophagoides farinae]|uniref:Transcription initiation factor tfiid subunit 5-like protein n=1 Tax=Dermatophagoides farinae TaxID=6954 RepID=A0A9D4NXV3_DERFA|nr:transcription initiation factor tfiid subunit 5-like protein [Dermatophagoides farinae]